MKVRISFLLWGNFWKTPFLANLCNLHKNSIVQLYKIAQPPLQFLFLWIIIYMLYKESNWILIPYHQWAAISEHTHPMTKSSHDDTPLTEAVTDHVLSQITTRHTGSKTTKKTGNKTKRQCFCIVGCFACRFFFLRYFYTASQTESAFCNPILCVCTL